VRVPPDSDLQLYFDAAVPGDTLVLEGKEYRGNFTLPVTTGDQYITVTTDAPLPASGTRIARDAHLPAIIAVGTAPAIKTAAGAHHWWFKGIRFASEKYYSYGVVRLGLADATDVAQQGHDFKLDHCIIHGDAVLGGKRGLELNSGAAEVRDSVIYGFFPGNNSGQDTQALGGWNGPGPFTIVNNYLEASGYPVMFGGAAPKIVGLIPSDIVVHNNHMTRPTEWKGVWPVKNLFELKNARNVDIRYNLFENNWVSAQAGMGILFTVNCDSGKLSLVDNVTFHYNILRNSEGGINILGRYKCGDGTYVGPASNIDIGYNLLEQISNKEGTTSGRSFQVLSDARNVKIRNNTVYTPSGTQQTMLSLDGAVSTGFVFANNVLGPARYGVMGSGKSEGIPSLDTFTPGAVFTGNVLVGRKASLYPPGNFFPATVDDVGFIDYSQGYYALSPSSPYLGKGANMTVIEQVRQAVPAGRMVQ
jgi:hypothetical protein